MLAEDAAAVWAEPDAMQRLRAESEHCKIALSSQGSVECCVPSTSGTPSTITLTVDDLTTAVEPFLDSLWQPMDRLGRDYQLAYAAPHGASASEGPRKPRGAFEPPPRRISQLVLVGGATKSPVVAEFAARTCGVAACEGVDPEHCVALGAAIQAGIMDGSVGGGLEMMDSLYVQELQGRVSGFQS